jgi:hypothetical protein
MTQRRRQPACRVEYHTGTGCAERTLVVRYPAGLPVGTAINNSASASITPVVGRPGKHRTGNSQ